MYKAQAMLSHTVTVPSGRTTPLSLASASRLVARGCSSESTTTASPFRCGIDTGTISSAKRPSRCAAAAFDDALAWARERHTFGKPLIENQHVQFTMAALAAEIEPYAVDYAEREGRAPLPRASKMLDARASLRGLKALVVAPEGKTGWRGPYLDAKGGRVPLDPWGHEYQYRYPGTKNTEASSTPYDLFSIGKDNKPDTEDDIGNW